MSNEEIVMTVKAEVKPATKQVDDLTKSIDSAKDAQKELNEQISIQNKVLNEMEKELVELKATQDKIPKGAFYAGMDDLNRKIKETEKNIKLEKLGLKDLENQQKDNNKVLKEQAQASKEVNKEAKDSIGNFKLMGVSLNGIKASFAKIIPLAKAMFGTIKAGLLSTGIGALLVAFGSLATYFTSTKRGADQLATAFAGIKAAVNVVRDRFASLGETFSNIFNQSFFQTLKDVRNAFRGITTEIKEEVTVMVELEKRVKTLRDEENQFVIQRAATRRSIESARLMAEDESKSTQQRILFLKEALRLEKKTVTEEIRLAKEKRDIQEEQMATAENMVEAEKKLADLEADLINKEAKSFRLQKRVQTEINELRREEETEEKRLHDLKVKNADEWEQQTLRQIEAIKQARLAYLSAVGSAVGQLGNLMEDGSASAKALALTEIAINTAVGFMQALNIAQKSSLATGPAAALAFPIFYASQVAAVLGAVNSAKGILGAGGGSVSTPTPSLDGSTPAPEMLSGAFTLSNSNEQQPVQAYVVTDNLTDNQNKLAYIRRRATI